MKQVIISPWSSPLRCGKKNAKNYPYWKEVVRDLRIYGIQTIQVGLAGEELIDADSTQFGLSLKSLRELVISTDGWASVDNFFHHLCATIPKKGVVVFGRSDPKIFGHESNVNLLLSRTLLRPDQFRWWEDVAYTPNVFVASDAVSRAIRELWL